MTGTEFVAEARRIIESRHTDGVTAAYNDAISGLWAMARLREIAKHTDGLDEVYNLLMGEADALSHYEWLEPLDVTYEYNSRGVLVEYVSI